MWFPDGRVPSPHWRSVQKLSIGLIAGLSFLMAFAEDPESTSPYDNPLAVEELTDILEYVMPVVGVLFPLVVALCATALIVRWRRSRGETRQQLKLMVLAAALIVSYMLAETFVVVVLQDGTETWIWRVFDVFAFLSVPVAAGVAILRYRLYDLDLIINRTLVYGTLSGILVGTYVAIVFALQRVLDPVTRESDIAIAASTLAVAALFRPLRARIQSFIDHRFYRSKFDAQRTLETFSTQLRDEVDLGELSEQLVGVVRDTMQPAHLSLWLRLSEPQR